MHAQCHAALVDNHQVFVVGDTLDGHEQAGLLRDFQRLHALAATVGDAVVLDIGALAVALFADHQDGLLLGLIDHHHADDFVAFAFEGDAAYASAVTAHRAYRILIEAHGTTHLRGDDHFILAVRQCHIHHAVALVDVDGDDAVCARTAVVGQRRLLNGTLACAEQHIVALVEVLVVELPDVEACVDAVVGLYVEHVLDGAPLRGLVAFWDVIHLQPVAATLLREEQHRVVHRGTIDVLDEVAVACGRALGTHAGTALSTELSQLCALDISEVRDGDDHLIISVEVLGVEFFT